MASSAHSGGTGYQYSPLKSGHIRILHLEEGNTNDTRLQYTLEHISLDRIKSFDALSYTWGPNVFSEYSLLDGNPFWLTPSCDAALRRLRDSFSVRTIWVDAICINQMNDEEKSSQVSLMRSIYGRATKVYIWLGESSGHGEGSSDHAMSWLQDVSVAWYPLLNIRFRGVRGILHPKDMVKLVKLVPDLIRSKARSWSWTSPTVSYNRRAVHDIARREWFRRMWTIQELVMAREPIMVCGAKAILWNNMVAGFWTASQREGGLTDIFSDTDRLIVLLYTLWLRMYANLELRESSLRRWVDPESPLFKPWRVFLDFMETNGQMIGHSLWAVGVAIAAIRSSQGLPPLVSLPFFLVIWTGTIALYLTPKPLAYDYDAEVKRGFINLLNFTRSQQASLPKDKIFALYGVLRSLGVPLPQPDYRDTYSIENAYLEFTQSIIRWRGSLDVLLEASGPWSTHAPSWVPDWSKTYRRLEFPEGVPLFNQPLSPSTSFTFSDNGRELNVQGNQLGHVVSCIMVPDARFLVPGITPGGGASSPHVQQSRFRHPATCTLTLIEWLTTVTYGFGDDLSSEDACKLLASVVSLKGVLTADSIRNWASILLAESQRHAEETGSETLDPQYNMSLQTRVLKALSTNQGLLEVHERLSVALAGSRSLFIVRQANKGLLVGAGPQSIRLNDKVVFLLTMPAPMAVRHADRSRPTFYTIGAVHILGAMQGELWADDREDDYESITLV